MRIAYGLTVRLFAMVLFIIINAHLADADPPTATSDPASDIFAEKAVLNATVNPNGLSTTCYFEYGMTDTYGQTTDTINLNNVSIDIAVDTEITGLNPESAILAKQREYDEPLEFDSPGQDITEFLTKLGEAGLNWSRGGRLYHVMGGGGKGKAVAVLSGLYRKMCGEIETIGLGNGLNDLPLLQEVDMPILVQKSDHSWEDMDLPRLRRVQGIGPEGWSRAISELLGP